MGKKTTIALLVCSAYLFTSFMLNSKYQRINNKLDKTISNQEMIWLKTNELKIDSLQLEIMDLGARLDSCIIVND